AALHPQTQQLAPPASTPQPPYVSTAGPLELDTAVHPFQPGDWVYVKSWTAEPLAEKWKGPYQVLLTTYTAAKVWGKGPWLHYSRVKKAPTGNWKSKENRSFEIENL
uniref:Murine leukemia virus integrase C-terminal domain-containing protein n=1 Tax=Aquila chrysaetos chrysaetos TaxID=223781 RepID=A0A663FHN0_AQUCH